MPGFVDIARDVFAFLEEDYGFSVVGFSEDRGGGWIAYVNNERGVAVKLLYEYLEAFAFVFVYRLVDGNMHENILPITDESIITVFDFNDALPSDEQMKPAYQYGERSVYYDQKNGLRNFLSDVAIRLQKYGAGVLAGDLAVWSDVEKKIKRRARMLNQ